jgi:hypothetical protein
METSNGGQTCWKKQLEVSGVPVFEISGSLAPLPEGKYLGMVCVANPDFLTATHTLVFQEKKDTEQWVMSFQDKLAIT